MSNHIYHQEAYESWWDAYEPITTPTEMMFELAVASERSSSCACGNPACKMNAKTMRAPHGKYSRYNNHGCRCDLCVAAYQAFREKYLQPPLEVCGCGNARCTRKTRRVVKHGLSCYFRHKCRCEICKEGMRSYQRERRARIKAKSGPPPAHLELVKVFAEIDSLMQAFMG